MNKMKYRMIFTTLGFVLAQLLFLFVVWDYNISEWDGYVRLLLVDATAIFMAVGFIVGKDKDAAKQVES